jgi:hypothetical protein
MADTVRETLDQLEAQVAAEIEAVRVDMQPLQLRESELQRELKRIQAARAAIDNVGDNVQGGSEVARASVAYWHYSSPTSPFRHWTMKQLVRHAMSEHFPNGSTANELLEMFHQKYGRDDIIRSSLSPQLSRMKVDGEIVREGLVWKLPPDTPALFEERETTREEDRALNDAEDAADEAYEDYEE